MKALFCFHCSESKYVEHPNPNSLSSIITRDDISRKLPQGTNSVYLNYCNRLKKATLNTFRNYKQHLDLSAAYHLHCGQLLIQKQSQIDRSR